jgi:dihydrofolate reductase
MLMGNELQIYAIVAMTPSRVIGNGNTLPWHLPEDLKQFKRRTTGHTILMGRKTFDSIGRPLPNRRNIVLTRQAIKISGVEVIHALGALRKREINGDLFVIGGAEIYRLALPYCHGLYLTRLKREYVGDVHFPAFEDKFEEQKDIFENEDFTVTHWVNKGTQPLD